MGNDPILSLSQSEVLNLYTMVTIVWYLRKESNLRPLVRSKVFYPLNYAGVLIFSNASLRIRNFLSWMVLLTSRYSMPSITCTALGSLQTTRSPLNLFLNVIVFIIVSLYGRSCRIRTHDSLFRRQVLYPTELRTVIGTRSRNRTYNSRVKVCCVTTTLSGNKTGLPWRTRTFDFLVPNKEA